MVFVEAQYVRITKGFQWEGDNLNDCELKCYYNLMQYMHRLTKDKAFKISMKETKNLASHMEHCFFSHEALVQNLDKRVMGRGYRLVAQNKSMGFTIEDLKNIVNSSEGSPALIRMDFRYFEEHGVPTKIETERPPDHCIMVLAVDWTAQMALIFDPMEKRICKKQNASYKRELSLPLIVKHWNASEEPGWASWIERKKSTQTKLEIEHA